MQFITFSKFWCKFTEPCSCSLTKGTLHIFHVDTLNYAFMQLYIVLFLHTVYNTILVDLYSSAHRDS